MEPDQIRTEISLLRNATAAYRAQETVRAVWEVALQLSQIRVILGTIAETSLEAYREHVKRH